VAKSTDVDGQVAEGVAADYGCCLPERAARDKSGLSSAPSAREKGARLRYRRDGGNTGVSEDCR
jgi:hypothetical protein